MEDKKYIELEAKIDELAVYNRSSLESIFEILGTFNNHFKSIEKELALIKTKIDNLDGDTSKNFNSVDSKLDDLGEKISQINKVTGFEGMFKNMQKLS
jgi:hypothetical protein